MSDWFVIKQRPKGGMKEIQENVSNVVWRYVCNCCDCENYPECPEGTDGCVAETIAKSASHAIKQAFRETNLLPCVPRARESKEAWHIAGWNDALSAVAAKQKEFLDGK